MASMGVPLPDKRSIKSSRTKRSVNARPPGQGGSGGEGGVAGGGHQYNHLRGESLRSADVSISSRSIRSAATTSDTLKKTETNGNAHGRGVRTMPTWVVTREGEGDDDKAFVQPPQPAATRRPPERSAHDAQREATPVTMQRPARESASRWRNFVEVSTLPPGTAQSEKLDDSWLDQDQLNQPWLASSSRGGGSRAGGPASRGNDLEANGRGSRGSGPIDGGDEDFLFLTETKTRQRSWYKNMQIMLLNSPMVPLAFRGFIWVLSLLALAFAGSIFQLSKEKDLQQKASTLMAIIVDGIALIYLIYITYDEYSGKPLGLRSPTAKMRLVMMDLVFIVFDSANLSLAFDTLFDTRWSCTAGVNEFERQTLDPAICGRQRGLSAFLFLALLGWISTFTVSLFRLVERVARSA